ncbi:MAG: type VII secretion integral membrane protein EccD [Actinocatenispora sp.]
MPQPPGLGLSHVSIAAPQRRIDVALPARAPVAELLPKLLQHAGEDLADAGEKHGGWALRLSDGTELDPNRSLSSHPVRDGEVLHLVPARTDWPETSYDDVVEAIASGARRYSRSWTAASTRSFGLVAAVVALALGLLAVLAGGPIWSGAGLCCLAVGVVLLVGGITMARALSDAVAGAVVGGAALPYALAGGLLVLLPAHGGITGLGAAQLLLGGVSLTLVSLVGYLGVGSYLRVFVAGVMTGGFAVLGGVVGLTSLTSAGTAALLVCALTAMLATFPVLAIRLGHLPVPALPRTAEDLRRTEAPAAPAEVFGVVVRADEVLTGLFLGAAVIAVGCAGALLLRGGWAGALLCGLLAVALLVRARLFPTVRQRIPLFLAGGAISCLLLYSLVGAVSAPVRAGAALGGAVVLGVAVTAAALVYSRRPASPYFGRVADILDSVLVIAVVPVACVVLDLYSWARGLAG